jgi:integrase
VGSVEPYETSEGRRYRVRYRKPDRSQTDKRGFKTKRDAELFLATVDVQQARGEWVDPSLSRVSVGAWAEEWFQAQMQLKPTTRGTYRSWLDKHILPRWATTRLADVTHGDIQKWITALSTTRAPSTVRQVHLALRGILAFAVRDGRLAKNPSEGVRLPRLVGKRRAYLTPAQVRAIAEACGDYGDVVLTLAFTGIRWGEMAALKVESLQMLEKRINVAEAVTEPRGQITWGTPKTHERRWVPMPDFLVEVLAARCVGKQRQDLVFTNANGGVLRVSNFRDRYFVPAVRAAQESDATFPTITPHDLRHTAASLAVSAGANVKAVQRMLGHKSAAMTLDVYSDLFDDDLEAVGTALNDKAVAAGVGKMWADRPSASA